MIPQDVLSTRSQELNTQYPGPGYAIMTELCISL